MVSCMGLCALPFQWCMGIGSLLITRSNGLYETRSVAAQILSRHRSVKRAVLFALGSGLRPRSLSVSCAVQL